MEQVSGMASGASVPFSLMCLGDASVQDSSPGWPRIKWTVRVPALTACSLHPESQSSSCEIRPGP